MHHHSDHPAAQLRACHRAALAAVAPGPALTRALSRATPPATAPVVIALGKAAPAMALAYCTWLATHNCPPAGGLIVTHEPAASPHAMIPLLLGDHPVPGERSFAAADALGALVRGLAPGIPVEVLLSGGTSSLIGAPRTGLEPSAYAAELQELLGSGRDIAAINAVRRRIGRWAGGRLGEALGDRPVRAWVLSDVPGDDLATIGSGPLVPDAVEPPRIPHVVIAGGTQAVEGAAAAWGGDVVRHPTALAGEAVDQAHAIVATLAATRPDSPTLHLWAGETFVTVPSPAGMGGRSQHLALAAAEALARLPTEAPIITLLAAGTDGQDGQTPATGAVVDGSTWETIARRGGDPAGALRRCDAFPALLRADALLVTGPTGTNVADLVLAVVGSPAA
jgi:hydroxypyruvate reductase